MSTAESDLILATVEVTAETINWNAPALRAEIAKIRVKRQQNIDAIQTIISRLKDKHAEHVQNGHYSAAATVSITIEAYEGALTILTLP